MQTNPIIAAIRAADWLKPFTPTDTPVPLTAQASFDYAASFNSTLKGVLAQPTPAKLKRLNELLASRHNLEDQLWRDMPMRLKETFESYGREYTALIETVADHSANPIQLYTAYRLASCLPASSRNIQKLADELGSNPAVKGAVRVTAKA